MAVIMVIISGWIGLAYAVAGHIVTGSTLGQFFTTWMVVGLVALVLFAVIAALRRLTTQSAAAHA